MFRAGFDFEIQISKTTSLGTSPGPPGWRFGKLSQGWRIFEPHKSAKEVADDALIPKPNRERRYGVARGSGWSACSSGRIARSLVLLPQFGFTRNPNRTDASHVLKSRARHTPHTEAAKIMHEFERIKAFIWNSALQYESGDARDSFILEAAARNCA